MPKTIEAEEVHLLQGLIRRPFFEGHAIGCDEDAGAIVAEAAVHENFLRRIVAEYREKLSDLFIGWRRPTANGNVDEAHAHRFGKLALPFRFFGVFTAEIDDGVDAQFFQLGKALAFGLRAAIENIGNFSGVVHTGNAKFLSVGGLHDWRDGRTRIGLSKKRVREKKRETQERREAFHKKLDANSVA